MFMHSSMTVKPDRAFLGISLGTFCNYIYIISYVMYLQYCIYYGLKKAIRYVIGRTVCGIGGQQIPIGSANIQITYIELVLIVDVSFMILEDKNASLMSISYMVANGIYMHPSQIYQVCGMESNSQTLVSFSDPLIEAKR